MSLAGETQVTTTIACGVLGSRNPKSQLTNLLAKVSLYTMAHRNHTKGLSGTRPSAADATILQISVCGCKKLANNRGACIIRLSP